MNRYTIYCTEEQTRKALELSAPLNSCYHSDDFQNTLKIGSLHYVEIPTAEQMIGWLEEQGVWIHFCKPNRRPKLLSFSVSLISNPFKREYVGGEQSSRKEATLAAIDAALYYLENKVQ